MWNLAVWEESVTSIRVTIYTLELSEDCDQTAVKASREFDL